MSEQCVHHWVIDMPNGRTSQGVCKNCGDTSEFFNSYDPVMSFGGRDAGFEASRLEPGGQRPPRAAEDDETDELAA